MHKFATLVSSMSNRGPELVVSSPRHTPQLRVQRSTDTSANSSTSVAIIIPFTGEELGGLGLPEGRVRRFLPVHMYTQINVLLSYLLTLPRDAGKDNKGGRRPWDADSSRYHTWTPSRSFFNGLKIRLISLGQVTMVKQSEGT